MMLPSKLLLELVPELPLRSCSTLSANVCNAVFAVVLEVLALASLPELLEVPDVLDELDEVDAPEFVRLLIRFWNAVLRLEDDELELLVPNIVLTMSLSAVCTRRSLMAAVVVAELADDVAAEDAVVDAVVPAAVEPVVAAVAAAVELEMVLIDMADLGFRFVSQLLRPLLSNLESLYPLLRVKIGKFE